MKRQLIAFGSVIFLLFFSSAVHAYVGPGLGLGVIGVIAGIFMALVLGIAGLCWYPLKRALGKGKSAKTDSPEGDSQEPNALNEEAKDPKDPESSA